MKTKTSLIILTLAFISILLSACGERPTAAQIKAEGQQYAQKSQADQDALNQEQQRQFNQDNQTWIDTTRAEKLDVWTTIKPTVKTAAVALVWIFALGVAAMALSTSAAYSYAVASTAKAYDDFAKIRARLVNVDPTTGTRPMIMWPNSQAREEGQPVKGLFARRIRNDRWVVYNAATGENAPLDVSKPANTIEQEKDRQIILAYLLFTNQAKTAKASPEGAVADAMGNSDLHLPDAGGQIIDLAKARELLQAGFIDRMKGDR